MSLPKIPKPDLESIQSISNPHSPIMHQYADQPSHPTSNSKESILPPSNLTDIESVDDFKNTTTTSIQQFKQDEEQQNHTHNTTSSSAYDSTSENLQHSPERRLLLTKSNVSTASSKEAIPVSIKLSQLPNTSSSSLLIGGKSHARNIQMSPVSTKLGGDKSIQTNQPLTQQHPEVALGSTAVESGLSTSEIPSGLTSLQSREAALEPGSSITTDTPQKVNRSIISMTSTPGTPSRPPYESPMLTHKKRESNMSNYSHYSGTVEYDAVPMTVKRSSSSKIKYVDHENKRKSGTTTGSERGLIETSQLLGDYDNDVTDEEDQSSILLGKLPTTSIHSSDDNESLKKVNNPDKSYVTNIEGSIPARSPRRPTSMVVSNFNIDDIYQQQREEDQQQQQQQHEKHVQQENAVANEGRRRSYEYDNKRRSIQINDGLEKLMLDASSFNSDGGDIAHKLEAEEISSPNLSSYIGKAYGITYTDTDSEEVTPKLDPITNDTLQTVGNDTDNRSITSKRSNDSVRSSRSNLPPRPKQDDIIKARRISSNLQHQQEQLRRKSGGDGTNNATGTAIILPSPGSANINPEYESSKLREIPTNRLPSQGQENYKSREIPRDKDRLSSSEVRAKHRTGIIGDIDSDFHVSPQNPNFQGTTTQADPISGAGTGTGVEGTGIKERKSKNIMVDDEGYYDITEPISLQQPTSRAKSVRKSIKRPNTSVRRKKKGTRSSGHKSSNNELRPFNYTTLISLLESMNGTIIGEEFNNLDIPIKEKQLIEKIIDSLSRLTSDMIIDQNRYDVGIERLEKCLRVLEGFL